MRFVCHFDWAADASQFRHTESKDRTVLVISAQTLGNSDCTDAIKSPRPTPAFARGPTWLDHRITAGFITIVQMP
ncbi:MAG: hypothetical protein Fues2KO_41020 [Fuerstiella sp.]